MKSKLTLLLYLVCLTLFYSSITNGDDKPLQKNKLQNGYEYNAPSYPTQRIYGETRRYAPVYINNAHHHHFGFRNYSGYHGYPYSGYQTNQSYGYSTPYSYGTHSLSVNWGSGGLTIGRYVPSIYPGQFVPYSGYGNAPYYYQPNYTQVDMYGRPLSNGQNPFNNSVLANARRENNLRWNGPLNQINQQQNNKLIPDFVTKPFIKSSGVAKLKSIRSVASGDVLFRKQKYSMAYTRYKKAVAYAEDQARAHFRLAYSLVAQGKYERAVKQFKRGLYVDPTYPSKGDSLDKVFGEYNKIAKSAMISKATTWAREDVRDADRLFLLGVLLHFNKDDRAGEFFATATRLSGGGAHLQAFLKPAIPEGKNNPKAADATDKKKIFTVPKVGPIKLPEEKPTQENSNQLPPLPSGNNTLPPPPQNAVPAPPKINIQKLFPE